MLPLALLALIQAQLVYSQQTTQSLQLNTLYSFSGSSIPKSSVFSLPQSSSLAVSVALCADGAASPQFFLTNDTSITQPGPNNVDGENTFSISLVDGFGEWNGSATNGGYLSVSNTGQTPIEIGVSAQGEYR